MTFPATIDLHVHTHYSSDGDQSPQAVAEAAHAAGLAVIAIADHDRLEGSAEAAPHCQRLGVRLIPAVEISTQHAGLVLHLLGYYVDGQTTALRDALQANLRYELHHAQAQMEQLRTQFGFDVTWEEVLALSPRAVPKLGLIAKAILTNGRNADDPRLTPYRSGDRRQQPNFNFYLDYMQTGRPAHVPSTGHAPALDAIALVRQSGGVPILAHPGGSLKPENRETVLRELTGHGLAGLEVYSSYHSPETEAWYQAYAEAHGLLLTAGSDFHGDLMKPGLHLGKISHNTLALVEKLEAYRQSGAGQDS